MQIHLPEFEEASKSPESEAGHIVLSPAGDKTQKIRLIFCSFSCSRVLCVSIVFYFKYIYLSGQPPARGELLSHDYAQVPLDRRFHGAGLDIFLVSRMFSDYGEQLTAEAVPINAMGGQRGTSAG